MYQALIRAASNLCGEAERLEAVDLLEARTVFCVAMDAAFGVIRAADDERAGEVFSRANRGLSRITEALLYPEQAPGTGGAPGAARRAQC